MLLRPRNKAASNLVDTSAGEQCSNGLRQFSSSFKQGQERAGATTDVGNDVSCRKNAPRSFRSVKSWRLNYTTNAIETSESLVWSVPTRLRNGQIREAVDAFADRFTFKDCGTELEFEDKERLTEFFQKAREPYRDSERLSEAMSRRGSNDT